MFQGVTFPQGNVVRKFKGGTNSLQKIVKLLRKRGYTGYLKVTAEGTPDVGYIVLGKGKRAVALFDGPDGSLVGRDALPRFKELAGDRNYVIEVHTELDVEPLLDSLPLEGGKRSRRKKDETGEKDEGDEGVARAERDEALEAIGQSLANVIEAFADKRKPTGGEDEDELESLELEQKSAEKEKTGSAKPRGKKGKEKQGGAKGDGKGAKKATRGKGRRKKGPKKRKKDRAKEEAPREEPTRTEAKRPRRRAKSKAPHISVDPGTRLLPRFTLEGYIVGESNRLAFDACAALAEGATEPYNPLLLVGEAGLGKTHLLHGVGVRFLARDAGLKVRYLTAGQFVSDLQRAIKEDDVASLREALSDLDVLLLDNVQDLDGKRRAQEEILEVFEVFHGADRPMILAGDRRPSEMERLDSRLVSRFQSGLVVQLKPPELEVRLAYLESHAESRGIACPDDVLEFLAETHLFDLRELEGALNRVLAYAATVGKEVDLDLTREALGETSTPAGRTASAASLVLRPAHSYLVEEERADLAYRIFAQRARDVRALLITRTNPARLRERFSVDGLETLWLTDRSESTERTVEPVLERLVHTVESYIEEGGPGILMLDGLEYLRSNNGFEPVLKFLRHVVDEVSESDFSFLMALTPSTLQERELRILEREMEVVRL